MSRLRDLVEVWQQACSDFVSVARAVPDDAWLLPTDCPGWSVKDIVAHAAAVESELAGDEPLRVTIDKQAPHIKNPAGIYTERGVVARRERAPADVIAELEDAVRRRTALLESEPLDDPDGGPPITPGRIGWSWQQLLRNRALDVWVHEQDIRRAIGKPGGLDSVGARHAQSVFAAVLPYVVGKHTDAPAGSIVVVDITGPVPDTFGVEVRQDGRGHPVDAASVTEPTVRLSMDTESFTILGAGRRDASTLPIRIQGDEALARQILDELPITP
ncbi:MAG: maleylpyruvate isomerase family mycothiol-dependent enzyme [Nocardioidaceae bacterium]